MKVDHNSTVNKLFNSPLQKPMVEYYDMSLGQMELAAKLYSKYLNAICKVSVDVEKILFYFMFF